MLRAMDATPTSSLTTNWPFDAELLRRYDRPGPRYTSYPTAPHFHPGFGEEDLRELAWHGNLYPVPRQLSLYLHVPYCHSPCFYCGCNRVITRDTSKAGVYLARLKREIAMVAPMFEHTREVIQLHLGGGTPNFMSPFQLRDLMGTLGRQFRFSMRPERDFSIELDPRHVVPAEIAALADMGFNRASLGVQDFDPQVQEAINRIQSVEQTLEIIDACRRYGLRSVNVDLIYGLPRQTLEGFGKTLDTVIATRPDRLAIYGYAHLPEMFRAQRQIVPEELPTAEQRLALLGLAVEKLAGAGYRYIGMDHFALPEDDLAQAQQRGDLHRNFMGYTTHADTDLIGLGVSAISHIGDSFSQNQRDLPSWEKKIDSGELPLWRGLLLDRDDVLRADIIQQLMCLGDVDIGKIEKTYSISFEGYFREELKALQLLVDDGLVDISIFNIRATPRGRGLLRVIAMCFDRYLKQPQQPARYSKAV